MRSSKASERRREKIVEYLRVHGKTSSERLCRIFGVSNETIRQDLLFLDGRGIVEKVHGGAFFPEGKRVEPFVRRRGDNHARKRAIVERALELLPEAQGLVLGMDTGSTVTMLAEALAGRGDCLVVTNSNPAMQAAIAGGNRLYALCGEYNGHDMAFQGEHGITALRELSLDFCFMGTSGVRNREGICTSAFHDVRIKREFVKRSRTSVVLTDSSKFFDDSVVEVTGWEAIDVLVTDSGIPGDAAARLEAVLDLIVVDA